MRRLIPSIAAASIATMPSVAAIETPARPITAARSLVSPASPAARPVPLTDISGSRGLYGAAWSADGRRLFVATNLTGRINLWRTDAAGSWPIQLTQSDEAQGGPAASEDGQWLYFTQDKGGNEYSDVLRVPVEGGAVENLTNTPDVRESDLLTRGGRGAIALSVKARAEGQTNLAVMRDGKVRLLTQEKDPQFGWSPVAWTNGGRTILAARAEVGGVTSETWLVDAASGRATAVLATKGSYHEPADITPDGRIVAVSTRDGTGQLHAGLYDIGARTWTWLKPTPWEQYAQAFVEGGRGLIVRTNDNGRSTLTRYDLATKAEAPLALDPGVNNPSGAEPVSPDGRTLLVSHSGADAPSNLYLYDLASRRARPATQLAMASLTPAQLPKSQVVTFRSFDGTPVSAIVTMPFNLKRDGRNPAIVMPHGGPTGQSQDGFSGYAAAFASRGYVVIQPNFRGSTGYGEAFQRANSKDLGGGDLKDVVAAKQFLVDSGYVDAARVGIFGGSYGGFMTLMAIGRVPDAFAAAVQWFGIINWRTMYRDQDAQLKAYQRSLLGTPDENPAVYDAASPLTYLSATRAPLLTIQGENDIRVPRGQAQEVADILKAKGNVVETIYYPGEGHGFRKRENQIDSLQRTVDWFERYLKPGTRR